MTKSKNKTWNFIDSQINPSHEANKQLRPYQVEDKNKIINSLTQGKRTIYQLATGGGKTEIALNAVYQMCKDGMYDKVFLVVHRKEIVKQWEERAGDIPIICGSPIAMQKEFFMGKNSTCNYRIVDPHTIEADGGIDYDEILWGNKVYKIKIDNIKNSILIFDECHRSIADTYMLLSSAHKRFAKGILGLTATPTRRNKNEGLGEAYDNLICSKATRSWLIRNKYLVDFKYICEGGIISGNKIGGEYNAKDIVIKNADNRTFTIGAVNRHLKYMKDIGQKIGYTLYFCVTIQHAQNIKKLLKERGIIAEVISADTEPKDRKVLYEAFQKGKYKCFYQ